MAPAVDSQPEVPAVPVVSPPEKNAPQKAASAWDKYTSAFGFLADHAHPPKPYAGAATLDYEEYVKAANTGDVLLLYGTDTTSKLIRSFTNGPFFHAALIFRGALPSEDPAEYEDKVRVLQATASTVTVDFEGRHDKEHGEVMLVDLSTLMESEFGSGENVQVTVRRLEADESKLAAIKEGIIKTAEETLLKPYTLGNNFKTDAALIAETKLPDAMHMNRKTFGSYVCSTLVGHALTESGVLNAENHPLGSDIHFFPKHFSEAAMPVDSKTDFGEGVRLGRETRLTNVMDDIEEGEPAAKRCKVE